MHGWSRKISRCFLASGLAVTLLNGCAALSSNRAVDPHSAVLHQVGGGILRFAQYRGRVLLVDFFTTWSQATALSIPGYVVLFERYRDQGLSFVGVALDDLGEKVVAPFVAGLGIPYPVALGGESVRSGRSPFGEIAVLPLLLVFDRRGELRRAFAGRVHPQELEELIRRLL